MDKDDIIKRIRDHEVDLRKLGVKSLAVFGSAARGEATKDSNVDILVEFADPATFDAYMDTKFFLEDLLRRQVDLVVESSLRPRLRPYVEQDAIYVT